MSRLIELGRSPAYTTDPVIPSHSLRSVFWAIKYLFNLTFFVGIKSG